MLQRNIAAIVTTMALACVAMPRASAAEEDLVSFAEKRHATAEVNHVLGRCGVCGSPRFESNQLVDVLKGRYKFEHVRQAYCPVCRVTTLTLKRDAQSTRFVRVLWWKLPASRGRIVRNSDTYSLAFASSDATPFISTFTGLEKLNGKVYLSVE